MSCRNKQQLDNALKWISGELDGAAFGEIGIKFIIHGGEIKRIEKTITEKAQALPGEDG